MNKIRTKMIKISPKINSKIHNYLTHRKKKAKAFMKIKTKNKIFSKKILLIIIIKNSMIESKK